jgi:hypothetical protein
MKPYAYYRESDYTVDWSRTCKDCWQFPNRCDHFGIRVLWLRVLTNPA